MLPIVIIGGGVIGSAIAYFLTLQQPVSYTHLDVYKRQAGRQLLQHGQHVSGIHATGIGQHHALAHTVEEGGAQLVFQLAYLA